MNPSLNNWTTLFLLAAGQGLFLVLTMVITNTRNKNFNWPIVILISFFSVTLVHYVMYWSGYIQGFPYLKFIPEIGFYLFGPLLLLYLNRILFHKKPDSSLLVHLIPSSWVFILGVIFWIFGSIPLSPANAPVFGRILRFPLWPWALVAHMFLYNLYLYYRIHKYSENKDDEIASIRKRWSRALNIFFSLFILAYSSYFFLIGFDFFKIEWDYSISIIMSLSIYAIGYMAFTQPRIFNGILLRQVFVPKKYKSSQLTETLGNELYEEIMNYFKNEKPFLNPELRQAHICEELGYTTHQVSQVINEKTGGNFNAFVKGFRLEYAADLILNNPEIDFKTVFYQSGFNNKTSFNAAFKHKYQTTPSQYRENIRS